MIRPLFLFIVGLVNTATIPAMLAWLSWEVFGTIIAPVASVIVWMLTLAIGHGVSTVSKREQKLRSIAPD